MFVHTVVYAILSLMSAIAAFAASMPMSRSPREEPSVDAEQDATDTPQ